MKRRVHLAWMQGEGLTADLWRALHFEVPLLRWSEQVERDAQAGSWNTQGEPRALAAIWSLSGRLLSMRHGVDERAHVRRGLGLLRRAWLAHCGGRKDLGRLMFANAEQEYSHAAALPMAQKAGEALLAEHRRRRSGNLAHRGVPEKRTAEIRKAIAANPTSSNRAIAKLAGVSESTVRRRRPKKK